MQRSEEALLGTCKDPPSTCEEAGARSVMGQKAFVIERRDNLSYEEFAQDYLYLLRPVIVTDVLRNWPAMRRWTPEFFQREFGKLKFAYYGADYDQEGASGPSSSQFILSDYIDRVLSSSEDRPVPYLRNKILVEVFPSLMKDIEPLPEYLFPNWIGERFLVGHVRKMLNRGAAIELFIGGKGSAFPVLHYDGGGAHAFLMQVYGRKEFTVYAPEQEPFLYPNPEQSNLSLIRDINRADLSQYPLFSRAVPTTFILEPGELLFVPSHWWHTTRMLTPSITLAVNVLNQSNWHELMKFVARKRRSPLVSAASCVYLTAAGAWRSWRDRNRQKRRCNNHPYRLC